MKAVEVRELVKDYGNFRAIRGISFEVNEGDTSIKVTVPIIIAGIKHVF